MLDWTDLVKYGNSLTVVFASGWPPSRKVPSTVTAGAWFPLKKAVSTSKPWTLPLATPSY